MKIKFLILILVSLFVFGTAQATTRYVREASAGTGDGSSWANASNDLQLMIDQNAAGDTIKIAGGNYKPTRPVSNTSIISLNDRLDAFVLKNNVVIVGGFNGSGASADLRDINAYVTTLDGDIGTLNDSTDNAFHVLVSLNSAFMLDGILVKNGNANNSSPTYTNGVYVANDQGAGIFMYGSSFTLQRCRFENNYSSNGAIKADGTGTIESCNINHNTGNTTGLDCNGNINVRNTIFSANAGLFGVVGLTNSTIRFYNCIFSGNVINVNVGSPSGMTSLIGSNQYYPSNVEIVNCVFSGNKFNANYVKVLARNEGNLTVYNSIIWGNAETVNPIFNNTTAGTLTVNNSIVQGGYAGSSNLDADPQFVGAPSYTTAPFTTGNHHLTKCSPAINAGNNSFLAANETTDKDGKTRVSGGTVDMGIYEYQIASPDANGIVYVDSSIANDGDGSSWSSAIKELSDALKAAKTNNTIQQIWVAKGTYKPLYTTDSMLCNANDNRKKSFLLRSNLKILGGFAGGETNESQRNPSVNITTLSGDIGTPEINADNAYHILILESVNGNVIDGFTLKDGNANGTGSMTANLNSVPHNAGAAIVLKVSGVSFAKNIIRNCRIANNAADNAAVWCDNASDAVFENTVFESNNGDSSAALQIQYSSSFEIKNCRFSGNTSYGGVVKLFGSNGDLKFYNDIFNGNKIFNNAYPGYFPGVFNNNADTFAVPNQKGTEIINCTFSGNGFSSQNNAYVIAKNKGKLAVKNCAFAWDGGGYSTPSATCTYNNCISNYGFIAAVGSDNNIMADAGFVNAPSYTTAPFVGGDYHLTRCSPAINTGSDSFLSAIDTSDFAGNKRKIAGRTDMGAYEYQMGTPDVNGVVYVDSSKVTGGDGSSWANAINEAADALKAAKYDTTIHQVWIASGTYKPLYTADSMLCSSYDNRKKSFVIPGGLSVYGGFAGTETAPSLAWIDEPWNMVHETILSGDIGVPDVNTDNVYHVVISSNNNAQSLLAGVTIEKGYGNDPSASSMTVNGLSINSYTGAGMINKGNYPANPINRGCSIVKCKFRNNNSFYGALAYVSCAYSNVSFTEIANNTGVSGGGIANLDTGYLVVQQCAVKGNTATTQGGGIYNSGKAKAYIASTLITGNYTPGPGGGIENSYADLTLTNCTIANNKADGDFGGIDHSSATGIKTLTLKNSILYDNSAANNVDMDLTNNPLISVANSSIGAGYSYGTNNVNAAPGFVSPELPTNAPTVSGDYHLRNCSPAINAGDTSVVNVNDADLDLLPRMTQNKVNLGAYQGTGYTLLTTPGDSLVNVISTVYDFSFGCNPIYYSPYALWNNMANANNQLTLSVNQPTGALSSVLPITFKSKLRTQYGSGSALQLSEPFGQTGYYYPMNRSWSVATNGSITSPVSVRFYFDDADSMDIAAQADFGTLQNLVVYKVNGTDAYNPDATGYKEYTYAAVADTNHFSIGRYQGIRYVEFVVTSFSSGSIALKSSTPLSIALGDITAVNVDKRNRIDWQTYNEEQSDKMILQRSKDGKIFTDIATVAAKGTPSSYTYWDEQPFSGVNYYRLKMMDKSAASTYSKIVSAFVNNKNAFAIEVFPNPATAMLHLNIYSEISNTAQIIVTNMEGKEIVKLPVSGAQQDVDVSAWADGIYFLKYIDNDKQQIIKISKQ